MSTKEARGHAQTEDVMFDFKSTDGSLERSRPRT